MSKRDLAFVIKRGQRLIEGLHSVLVLAGLHHRVDLVDLVFADQVSDGAVGNQDFERHRAAASFSARQQRLAQNSFEHERKLRANLRLLIGRKDVDDTVDGRGGRICVQRGERKVAGFCDAQRRFDRFEVAHFADQHHVRILAKRSAQRCGKSMRVGVDFALVDQTALVVVQKLDRIFDRQNVFVTIAIDLVDHRRQRR